MGARDLKSGFCVYSSSILPTKLFPKPLLGFDIAGVFCSVLFVRLFVLVSLF